MKLDYMLEDDVIRINNDTKTVFEGLTEESPHLNSFLDKTDFIFSKQDIDYEDITLDVTEYDVSDSPKSDFKNIKAVYSSLKSLSDSLATDRRIWTALAFGRFYSYMRYRWPAQTLNSFEERYIITSASKRALIRQGISRLWWFGRLTYDPTITHNPYELTEYLCEKGQDCMENLCNRTVFDNFVIMKGILKAMRDADKDGMNVDREAVRDIAKYVNILGSNYIVDYFTEDEIHQRIYDKLKHIEKMRK